MPQASIEAAPFGAKHIRAFSALREIGASHDRMRRTFAPTRDQKETIKGRSKRPVGHGSSRPSLNVARLPSDGPNTFGVGRWTLGV